MFYSITLLNLTCSDYTLRPAEYQGKLQLIKKNLSPEIGTVNPYVVGSSPTARATFYTVHKKGGFSLDF